MNAIYGILFLFKHFPLFQYSNISAAHAKEDHSRDANLQHGSNFVALPVALPQGRVPGVYPLVNTSFHLSN